MEDVDIIADSLAAERIYEEVCRIGGYDIVVSYDEIFDTLLKARVEGRDQIVAIFDKFSVPADLIEKLLRQSYPLMFNLPIRGMKSSLYLPAVRRTRVLESGEYRLTP